MRLLVIIQFCLSFHLRHYILCHGGILETVLRIGSLIMFCLIMFLVDIELFIYLVVKLCLIRWFCSVYVALMSDFRVWGVTLTLLTLPTNPTTHSIMDLNFGPMASLIGVSIPVLRFLLCFVATIPVSFIWRLIPVTSPVHFLRSKIILSGLRKGIWTPSDKGKSPSPHGPSLRAILQAAICMGLYLYLVPQFPLPRFTDPVYQEWGFWKRMCYQYMAGFTARWKYYFIWSISESSIIISGLGFSGWTNSSPPKPRWDRAKNVDILGVELAKSSVQLPPVWNIQVSTWLRHYVYERLIQKGKKPGFFQLLATQTVSAVWHGLYLGYIIFFVQSALMIAGSRGGSNLFLQKWLRLEIYLCS